MIQLLPQSSVLCSELTNPTEVVEYINSYIDNYHCETLYADISAMNIIDACYVTTMCSTKHFIKYPNGKISWKVSSELVRDFNKNLELGNADYI